MSQTSAGLRVSRQRLLQIRRAHRGTFGIAELIGLFVAGMMVLTAIVAYLYLLAPAESRGLSLVHERDHLKQQLNAAQADFKKGVEVKERVEQINVSLEKFEEDRLADRDAGRLALYEDLNQLMHKNSLRNSSGPTYTPLEPLSVKPTGQVAAASTSANKWQSIYPGVAVNVTVEGQYKDLRHFVRDIEASKGFIIINAVELERATGSNAQLPAAEPEAGAPKSASGSALVSLRLDLATYFSRSAQPSEKPAVNAATVH